MDDIGDIYSWLLFIRSAKSLEGRTTESLRESITDKLEELALEFKKKDDPESANLVQKYHDEIAAI